MVKLMFLIVGCLTLLTTAAVSQELAIPDFPIGVGGSVNLDLFKPYDAQLKAISDTLHKYPLARAIITGGADGEYYRQDQDAKNPGLALGRAHVLRNVLIGQYKVDSTQIVVQTNDLGIKSPNNRYASVRIDRALSDMAARLDSLEKRAPVEKHFTEVQVHEVKTDFIESFGLQFGLGVSTSPFGAMPIATGAITYKRIVFVEAVVGHSLWNGNFPFEGADLSTKRRMSGANVIVYPFKNVPVGIVGGWMRMEQISLLYYKYVKMSEGPALGLRVTPLKFLSVTGTYNPAKQRLSGLTTSLTRNGQFVFSAIAHVTFGGEK